MNSKLAAHCTLILILSAGHLQANKGTCPMAQAGAGKTCSRGMMPQHKKNHVKIRHDFLALQNKAGMQVDPAKPKQHSPGHTRGMHAQWKHQRHADKDTTRFGGQTSQAAEHHKKRKEMNVLRTELNELFKKDSLSMQDIKTIDQKIDQLNALNPQRWPQAADYKALLNARMTQQIK